MPESDSNKPGDFQSTEHRDAEPEKAVKKTQKRGRKAPAKKQALLPAGKLRSILAAAIILCLGLIGFIIFLLASDTTPPVIQKVSVSDIAEGNAIIIWQTSRPATSQVMVCNPDCTPTEPDETLATHHSISLTDLKPNTRYQLILISRDKGGNEARLEIELTTPVLTYSIPLVISELRVSDITHSSASIAWRTDRPATSQVEYGETDSYGSITPPNEELTIHHSIILTGLKPTKTYNIRVKSRDAGGNEAISEARTIITLSAGTAAVEIGPEIGKRAPDFTLPTLDGEELSLSQFHGKIIMVNFWITSCDACASEMPLIQAVFDGRPRDELEILAVNMGEREAFVRNFVDKQGLTFPALLDSDEEVSDVYQISRIPTTFFINADGVITEIRQGHFTSQFEIEAILNSL